MLGRKEVVAHRWVCQITKKQRQGKHDILSREMHSGDALCAAWGLHNTSTPQLCFLYIVVKIS